MRSTGLLSSLSIAAGLAAALLMGACQDRRPTAPEADASAPALSRRGPHKPGFIAGGAIELGGRLPLNTHGGQLGEAYIHGMNGIAEAVRQVRGTSVNQVDEAQHVLVTAGTGVPTSGLVLGER